MYTRGVCVCVGVCARIRSSRKKRLWWKMFTTMGHGGEKIPWCKSEAPSTAWAWLSRVTWVYGIARLQQTKDTDDKKARKWTALPDLTLYISGFVSEQTMFRSSSRA